MDLKEIGLVNPDHHWYYRSKLAVIARELSGVPQGGCVIDVGAGSGFFARSLVQRGLFKRAICVDVEYDEERHVDSVEYVRSVDDDRITSASVILMIDVLEHVEDDGELLRHYVERSRVGTTFVLTVPAFQSLWSSHDEFLGHHRRYRRHELIQLAENSSITVHHARYLFGSLVPPALLMRTRRSRTSPRSHMRVLPTPIDRVLRGVFATEHAVRWNPVAGLTALVVGTTTDRAGHEA